MEGCGIWYILLSLIALYYTSIFFTHVFNIKYQSIFYIVVYNVIFIRFIVNLIIIYRKIIIIFSLVYKCVCFIFINRTFQYIIVVYIYILHLILIFPSCIISRCHENIFVFDDYYTSFGSSIISI